MISSCINNLLRRFQKDKRGNLILFSTIFGLIAFSITVTAVSGYALGEHRASIHRYNSELAFQVAEAGLNYYRWHLAHDTTDYQDGTGEPGPYIHEYKDKDGKVIGYFSLDITPPLFGTTVVEVESTGWLINQPDSKRVLNMRLGFKSITDYSILSDADVWIGNTEKTFGRFHSNHGIRYDGTGNAPITSAVATYTCKYHQGCGAGQSKPGIWGDGGPKELWNFPVPATDFAGITVSLAEIKAGAQENGVYLSPSGDHGYRIRFIDDGTIEVRKVLNLNCYKGNDINNNKQEWFCIDIKSLRSQTTVFTLPTSSYIYVDDNVWVDGVVNGRATIGTGSGKSIVINDNLTYVAKDGNHVLGLIASENVLLPYNSPNDLEVNAAMIAQNGAAKRYYYPGNKRDNLLVYGSVITKGIWTWSWDSGGGVITSGYVNTIMVYDENLTFGPPSGFPVGTEYQILSWKILQ